MDAPIPMKEATRPNKDKLAADFRALISDAEELLRTTAGYSGDSLAVARTRLAAKVEEWKGLMAQGQDLALDRGKRAAEMTDQYVRDNPWRAVGITLAIGIILGMWSRR
jgi:ElaB/YqjD/DUF883 family membrane-anchored ribosome-binding protein